MKTLTAQPTILAAALALVLAGAYRCQASVIIDGDPGVFTVTFPGSPIDVLLDGYSTANAAYPSTFRDNFLVVSSDNTTFASAPIAFSRVPYTNIGGAPYFAFLYDLQETRKTEYIGINTISIAVRGREVWSAKDAIDLNPAGRTLTLKPLGNGADMALLIPVSLFYGMGLTGADTLVFSTNQTGGNNGSDEWIFSDEGLAGGIWRFGPNDPIGPLAQVPEPSSMTFLLAGASMLCLARMARKNRR